VEGVDGGDGAHAELAGISGVLFGVDLDELHRALLVLDDRSRIGPSVRHGPHQGAQKSTMTGWVMEASTTSAMKP
jgi:hypothetical protein